MSDEFHRQFADRATQIADRWRSRLGAEAAPAAPPASASPAGAVAAAETGPTEPAANLSPGVSTERVTALETRARFGEFYAAVVEAFDPERLADILEVVLTPERRLVLTRLASVCNEDVVGVAVRWTLKSDRRRMRLKELTQPQDRRTAGPMPTLKESLQKTAKLGTGSDFEVSLRTALEGRSPSLWRTFTEGTDARRMRFAAQQFLDPRQDFNVVTAPLRKELQRDERRAGDERGRLAFLRRDRDVQALKAFVTASRRDQAQTLVLLGGSSHDRCDLVRRLVRDLAPKVDTPVVLLSLDRPILASDAGLRRDFAIQAPALASQLIGDGAVLTTVPKGVSQLVVICDRADHMVRPKAGEAPLVTLLKALCRVFGPRLRMIVAGEPSDALRPGICPEPQIYDLDAPT